MTSLLNKTTAQKIAERIDSTQSELLNHVESILRNIHAAANTDGQQQAILDVFGTGATAALTKYATLYAAISALNPSTTVPAPDMTVFQPQPDGTVLYVAPPEPEQPEEEIQP